MKYWIVAIFISLASFVNAQTSEFSLAVKYQDYELAKKLIYQKIAEKPNVLAYKDTLAFLYSDLKSYSQALAVCDDILKTEPNRLHVLELKASILWKTKDFLGLEKVYQVLFKETQDLKYAYYQVSLLFELNQYQKAEKLSKELLEKKESHHEKIAIYTNHFSKEITLSSVLYNVLGMIAMNEKRYKEAQKYFEKSLSIASDFLLASNNLQVVKTKLAQNR
ncbi:MAG: tetratricopeptide repeat protein [Cytophagales bacterium]|nr:tetratricopeptide repeat protein [Cytophagales bacterium]